MVVFGDRIWFSVFEICLFGLGLWACIKVRVLTEDSPVSGVIRSPESRKYFLATTSVVNTVVISVVFSITTWPKDGKVILYILSLLSAFYLTAWNGWSTNKLMGLKSKFQTRNFNPHRES